VNKKHWAKFHEIPTVNYAVKLSEECGEVMAEISDMSIHGSDNTLAAIEELNHVIFIAKYLQANLRYERAMEIARSKKAKKGK